MNEDTSKAWYETEAKHAKMVAVSWLGHPAVRTAIDNVRPLAITAVMNLTPYLVDQIQISRFCCCVCQIGLVRPDGSEEPNPFDPDGPDPWPLTSELRHEAGFIAALFHKVIVELAEHLASKGVQLDPGWASDQSVIGMLLLLPGAGYEIPWDGPAEELADQLQPPGVSAIFRDGRGGTARDGRNEVMAINAEKIRKQIRERQGGRNLMMPYAGGKTRALPQLTRVRRDILREIHAEFPGMTVAKILMTYGQSAATVGGRLRCELKKRLGKDTNKPSQSVLYNDFTALGLPARPTAE